MSNALPLMTAIALLTLTAPAAADQDQSLPGSQCVIVSGPAQYTDGGIEIRQAGFEPALVQCPIQRSFQNQINQTVRVFVRDESPDGSAACRLRGSSVSNNQEVPFHTLAVSSAGSNSAIQELSLVDASFSQVAASRTPLYVECELRARFGHVAIRSYRAAVL